MTESDCQETATRKRALERQANLTKPPGSLGRLEDIAVQVAAFQHDDCPSARPSAALMFAADHPVTKHQVSPYPAAVTQAMLSNFARGGAAASVLARAVDIPLNVVDVGVFGGADACLPAGDIRVEDAMSPEVFEECVSAGATAVSDGLRVLVLGEMGIGNSTPAAALCAWTLGLSDPTSVVGAGTGAKGRLLSNKEDVVCEALARVRGESRPREILRRIGGRELAALYGAMERALNQRTLVLVDGFIVSAVAAILLAGHPELKSGMIFAHCSAERGHAALLRHLGAKALLDLDLRLGEASGALTALPLLEMACALHNQMATFESARVPGAIK